MTLVKLLTLLIVIHVALAFAQVATSYYGAGMIEMVGEQGIITHTPIGKLFPKAVTGTPQTGGFSVTDIPSQFQVVYRLGDMIVALTNFKYGVLDELTPDDGLVFEVVVVVRLVGVLIWFAAGLAFLRLIFDSGILNSKLALALVAGGVALSGISFVDVLRERFTEGSDPGIITVHPGPNALALSVGDTQAFTLRRRGDVEDVTVELTNGASHATVELAEASLDCSSRSSSQSLGNRVKLWFEWCSAGNVTIRFVNDADTDQYREYMVQIE